jgi:hypothetical protein
MYQKVHHTNLVSKNINKNGSGENPVYVSQRIRIRVLSLSSKRKLLISIVF